MDGHTLSKTRQKPEPLISVIIPVEYEQPNINSFIQDIKDSDDSTVIEIIVVDSSQCMDCLRGIKIEGVRKLFSPAGKSTQMNIGAEHAQGDILLFLDPDCLLPRQPFLQIRAALADWRCVGGAFDLKVESEDKLIQFISNFYSIYSRLSRTPCSCQGIFIRKQYFKKIGGYKEIPIMEDVELIQRIKHNHGRIVILNDYMVIFDSKWKKQGTIYTAISNIFLRLLFNLGVPPEILADKNKTHKSCPQTA